MFRIALSLLVNGDTNKYIHSVQKTVNFEINVLPVLTAFISFSVAETSVPSHFWGYSDCKKSKSLS